MGDVEPLSALEEGAAAPPPCARPCCARFHNPSKHALKAQHASMRSCHAPGLAAPGLPSSCGRTTLLGLLISGGIFLTLPTLLAMMMTLHLTSPEGGWNRCNFHSFICVGAQSTGRAARCSWRRSAAWRRCTAACGARAATATASSAPSCSPTWRPSCAAATSPSATGALPGSFLYQP